MARDAPGYELPMLLFLGFRAVIDETHAELARLGYPDLKPMHGFIFQAIGAEGTTAVELGRRIGVTKQAAGKTIATLEHESYVERVTDPRDRRRKIVRLTERGSDVLALSAQIFDTLRDRWGETIGADRLAALQEGLRTVTSDKEFRLDVPGWFGDASRDDTQ